MVTHRRPIASATNVNMNLMEQQTMTKEELLDHFATNAMTAQVEKMGITNPFALAQTAYRLAKEMVAQRECIFNEWKREEETQYRYKNADIQELDLPIRYQRCLVSEGILMKEDLLNWSERELKRVPNLGAKGLQYVKEAMVKHGLKLKGQE
jgi:DNA-directed RNA polymerase alpha subunit